MAGELILTPFTTQNNIGQCHIATAVTFDNLEKTGFPDGSDGKESACNARDPRVRSLG